MSAFEKFRKSSSRSFKEKICKYKKGENKLQFFAAISAELSPRSILVSTFRARYLGWGSQWLSTISTEFHCHRIFSLAVWTEYFGWGG